MHKRGTFEKRVFWRRIALLIILVSLLYGVLPRVSGLEHSWQVVVHANKELLGLAVLGLGGTYLASTFLYICLALHRLPFWATLNMQVAAGLAGKALPAGLGSIGLGVAYLKRQQHKLHEAAAVVGANTAIGFIGYCMAFLGAVIGLHAAPPVLHVSRATALLAGAGIILAVGIALAFVKHHIEQWLKRSLRAAARILHEYRQRPWRLATALLLAALQPALFTSVLYCSAAAIGVQLSLGVAFTTFSIGLAAATATPTPGGVVGAEAGLTAALAAYGIPSQQALIIALLYRFITYWLPLAPGSIALLVMRKRYF